MVILMPWMSTTHANNQYIEGAALSGIYTVGTVNADFLSLAEALNAINVDGMAAPVEFQIQPGVYQVHVTIGALNRMGQADDLLTVTAEDVTNPPILQRDAQTENDNWLIKFDAASYINIKNLILEATGSLDLNNIVLFDNGNSFVKLNDNEFNSYVINTSTSTNQGFSVNTVDNVSLNNISIVENIFNSGNGGINIDGDNLQAPTQIKISENVFSDQNSIGSFYSILLQQTEHATVSDNMVLNDISNAKGIRFFSVDGQTLIERNFISMYGGGNGSIAMRVELSGDTVSDRVIIKNNMISAASKGLFISSNSHNVDVFHNTIMLGSMSFTPTNTDALTVSDVTTNIKINNNIVGSHLNSATVNLLHIEDSTNITESNHNVFHGPAGYRFFVNGSDYSNLAEYQNNTGLDINSVAKDLDFVDADSGDFHLSFSHYGDLDLVAPTLAEVTVDIDGEERSLFTPLKGGDELLDSIFVDSFESN